MHQRINARKLPRMFWVFAILFLLLAYAIDMPNEALAAQDFIGKVTNVEGKTITIMSSGATVIRNERIEVFNNEGHRVATVSVRRFKNDINEITCTAMRGAHKIEPGYDTRRRQDLRWALIAEASSFPIDATANPEYTDLTGIVSDRVGALGRSIVFGGIFRPGPEIWRAMLLPYNLPLQFQVTTGFMDLGPYTAWQVVDIGPIWRYEVYPERFNIEFGGSWALIAPMKKMKWARADGTYPDKITANQGETSLAGMMTYKAWTGVSYQFSREFTFFCRAAYVKYTFGNKVDSAAPDDSTGAYEGYQIRENWLESNINAEGGVAVLAGIQLWFK